MSASSRKHKADAPTSINFALVMCSTSRFARAEEGRPFDDPSGALIAQKLKKAGHKLVFQALVPDDQEMIQRAVRKALETGDVEAVVLCGGTGIASTDVTIEAVTPMLKKVLPGFGELFRRISYESIGSAAIMTRSVAGISEGKAIFCIPGSIDAVKLCLDKLILPETAHIVKHAREKS